MEKKKKITLLDMTAFGSQTGNLLFFIEFTELFKDSHTLLPKKSEVKTKNQTS